MSHTRSNMRLLRRILVQPRSTLDNLRSAIDGWEVDLVEYVQRGNKDLDDPQKITILLSMVPETLEDHLEMNIGRLDTYQKAGPRSSTRSKRPLKQMLTVVVPPQWSWMRSKESLNAKERAPKVEREQATAERATLIRTLSVTCAARRGIGSPIAGTRRPMVVQANHLGRKVHPLSPARVASPKEKARQARLIT